MLAVSLENVLLDVRELNRGMELTKREYSMHGHNTMLKEFIAHNENKLKKLQDDAKIAQVTPALLLSSHARLPEAPFNRPPESNVWFLKRTPLMKW